MRNGLALVLLLAALPSLPGAAYEAGGAQSVGPCLAAASSPAYSDPPTITVWKPRSPNRSAGAAIPVCGAFGGGPFKEQVALAGRFAYRGDARGLLARFGAVSRFTGLHFWAVAAQSWDVLIAKAHAIDGPRSDRPRADFTPDEMAPGRDLFFAQEDAGAAEMVYYHMRVVDLSPDRITLAVENTSSVRMFLFPLFDQGDLRFVYRLERLSPDEWGFYSVFELGPGTSSLAQNRDSSYINRMTAIYRHIAAIPDTKEPPAARD